MPLPELTTPVPHSVGLNHPQRLLPPGACDSHMHIFDPRFAPSPHWPRTPPVAPVAVYRQLQVRLGTTRTVVVTPSTYGTDNACTLDALDQLGDSARRGRGRPRRGRRGAGPLGRAPRAQAAG